MTEIVFLFLLLGGISFWQLRIMRRLHFRREMICYCLLTGGAMLIGYMLLDGVEIPSPAGPLQKVFEPVGEWVFPPD
ncbi:hypothetical protein JJB07_23415 [Tumebacillus sp. ITR2]|uniref:Uncharacterized protein n=1 Tax=Tumebacillus amylolyticus TaxID=2801339 RepID=A0ABS1JGT7_9BACL|nr:hypothetical protein [Tumebacillus amylolyticus]MBL0389496.1 hypothetical protein [Tumebacillus amylolyticus]